MSGGRAPARGRRGALALAAAGALAAGGLVGGSVRAQDAARLNPLHAPLSDLRAFRDRPLFTPSRKAPPVTPSLPERSAAARVEVEDDPPSVRLAGIVHGPAAAMAILQRPDSGGRSTVRIGDAVDGWIVTAIDSASIRLASGSREREYRLFARNSAPVSGPDHAAVPGASRDVP